MCETAASASSVRAIAASAACCDTAAGFEVVCDWKAVIAFDTGPANAPLNDLMQSLTGTRMVHAPYANGGRASGIGGLFPIPGQPQGKQLQALQAQAQALVLARAKAQAQKPVPQVGWVYCMYCIL